MPPQDVAVVDESRASGDGAEGGLGAGDAISRVGLGSVPVVVVGREGEVGVVECPFRPQGEGGGGVASVHLAPASIRR